jgi:hypothetical protein
MIKTIFVHLDDANPIIQKEVDEILRRAARVDMEKFMKHANEALAKFKHPTVC